MSINIRQIKVSPLERSNTLNHVEGGNVSTIKRLETHFIHKNVCMSCIKPEKNNKNPLLSRI